MLIFRVDIMPTSILKRALNLGASSLIMVHNHPSGSAKPSNEDLRRTVELNDFLMHAGISVFDHLIVAKQKIYSINQRKLILGAI